MFVYRRYGHLALFDRHMNEMERQYQVMGSGPAYVYLINEGDRIVAYRRGELLFVFSFNSTQSFESYRIVLNEGDEGSYEYVLSTERRDYGMDERIDERVVHQTQQVDVDGGTKPALFFYIPNRTAQVLKKTIKK